MEPPTPPKKHESLKFLECENGKEKQKYGTTCGYRTQLVSKISPARNDDFRTSPFFTSLLFKVP